MKSFVALSLVMASTAVARTMTVYNACPFTIWPALFTSSGGRPSHATGWIAPAFSKEVFDLPSDWDGRIWGRRDCDFSSNPGPNSCVTGGCNGVCDINTASLAEFKLAGAGDQDFYDLSLVNGYNLPYALHLCADGPFDSSGFPVGCKSACTVDGLNGQDGNSANSCSGSHGTPQTCPKSGVQDYSFFKSNCPNAYAYTYDESSESALWTCAHSKNEAYTVGTPSPSALERDQDYRDILPFTLSCSHTINHIST
ncbi:thaumatin-like protein [Mycena alexandri]|uniref:Thaumatin-like protein n=1 Tax=Mycena alexandri TaxID=1745969 RepID=A0AAD6X063_9AGAR|nr:thaumatin-like protein [Mycena alexandri]